MPAPDHQGQHRSFFYQNGQLVIDMGTVTRRVLSFRHVSIAQTSSQGNAPLLLQTDQSHSVIGNPGHHYTAYGFAHLGIERSLIKFTGQPYDGFSGCYPLGNGHRYFNPRLMRFVQSDQWSPFERGGTNSYAYCQNDPINRHDPTGRFFQWLRTTRRWLGRLIPGRRRAAPPLLPTTSRAEARRDNRQLPTSNTTAIGDTPSNPIERLGAIYQAINQSLENAPAVQLIPAGMGLVTGTAAIVLTGSLKTGVVLGAAVTVGGTLGINAGLSILGAQGRVLAPSAVNTNVRRQV